MENKDKIKKISNKAVRILNVVEKLFWGLIIILSICVLVLLIGSFTDLLYNLINNNLIYYGDIVINMSETTGFINTTKAVSLKEVLDTNQFYDLMADLLGGALTILANLIISLVLIKFANKLFKKINEVESPFSLDLVKTIKSVFIVTTILVVINAPLIGLIVGFALSCFYFLYKYGCELQNEYDETI